MRMLRLKAVVLVGLLLPSQVSAQGLWTEASTVGYGATGATGALLACWSCDYGAGGVAILAGGVAGSIAGYWIGRSAESAARRGERPTGAELWGARVGTVLASATLGAGLGALLIDSTESNAPGDDERLLAILTLAGAAAGVLVEARQERGLPAEPREDPVRLFIAPNGVGGVHIGVRRALVFDRSP